MKMRWIVSIIIIVLLVDVALAVGTHYIKHQDGANLSFGDDLMWVDDTNDRVGFKTKVPRVDLDINGSSIKVDSSTPVLVGRYTSGTYMAGPYDVYVQGKYAYVAVFTGDRLTIMDVSNPYSPTLVSSLYNTDRFDAASGIFVAGKYAYITAAADDMLTIADVSNPYSPSVTGYYTSGTYLDAANSVYVSGKYAYVTSGATSDRFTVIDISNSSNPTFVSSYQSATYINDASGLYVQGTFAYIASYASDCLAIINISNASNINYVNSICDGDNLNGAYDVYVSGKYAYVADYYDDSLTIVNISNPFNMQRVSTLSDSTNLNGANGIYVAGGFAYVSSYDGDSIAVIDVSNVTNPVIVGTYANSGYIDQAYGLYGVGKYLYLVGSGTSNTFAVFEHGGVELAAASIGDVASNNLDVSGNLEISNDLYVGNGMYVGPGGVYVDEGKGVTTDGNLIVHGNLGINTEPTNALTVNGFVGANANVHPITALPPTVDYDVGWKIGLYSNTYAIGIASWTLAIMTNTWVDWFYSPPLNNADGTTPDSNAEAAMSVDSGEVRASKWYDKSIYQDGVNDNSTIDLWDGTDSSILMGDDPWGGSGDAAWITYLQDGSGEDTELQIGISNDADDKISFVQQGAEVMTIRNGRVGIYDTNPGSYNLQVQGNMLANNWVRVNYPSGVYWENYGGGWYTPDGYWLYSYGGKNVRVGGTLMTDHELQVGPNGDKFIVKATSLGGYTGILTTTPASRLSIRESGNSAAMVSAMGLQDNDALLAYRDGSSNIGAYGSATSGTGVQNQGVVSMGANDYGVYGYGDYGIYGCDANNCATRYGYLGGDYGAYGTDGGDWGALGGPGWGAKGYTDSGIAVDACGNTYGAYFTGDPVKIGSAGTMNNMTLSGDLYVYNDFEVDGTVYLDNLQTYINAADYLVYWNGVSKLCRFTSSERYKEDIHPFEDDFSKILKLEPKAFTRINSNISDFGYIAEEIDALGIKNLVRYLNNSPEDVSYEHIPIYIVEMIKINKKELDEMNIQIIDLESGVRERQEAIDYMNEKLVELKIQFAEIETKLAFKN